MKSVVITGGPCAGKSLAMTFLRKEYKDKNAFFAPEIATLLLAGGFPRSTKQNLTFQQKAIFSAQLEMENLLFSESNYDFYFFDRGLIDSLAYVDSPEDIIKEWKELYLRYDLVLHLEICPEEEYKVCNNLARTEGYSTAKQIESRLAKLWQDHPNYKFIPANESFENKLENVQSRLN